jgi:hypothetical protein
MRLYCTYFNFYREHRGLKNEARVLENKNLQKIVDLLIKNENI